MIKQGIVYYFVLLNVLVYLLMAYVKRQAVQKKWRVPERRILFLGLIGGGFGGLIARQQFRHKTQKSKFLISFLLGCGLILATLYIFYNS